ncbi:hypothetical protein G9A89_006416 [Geosiphon pyriformis]|nr:hypothetical protein G9A89_006416 [Geosiphon pyriformis]
MYGNVGLSTPRGSGTNGYVVRNLSFIRPRKDVVAFESYDEIAAKSSALANRTPNKEILEHDKKRQIELECMLLRKKLEDDGAPEEEVEGKIDARRQELLSKLDEMKSANIQDHQTHQLSEAKAVENVKMMRALGIDSSTYLEGAAFDKELQEQKRIERKSKRDLEFEKKKQNFEEREHARNQAAEERTKSAKEMRERNLKKSRDILDRPRIRKEEPKRTYQRSRNEERKGRRGHSKNQSVSETESSDETDSEIEVSSQTSKRRHHSSKNHRRSIRHKEDSDEEPARRPFTKRRHDYDNDKHDSSSSESPVERQERRKTRSPRRQSRENHLKYRGHRREGSIPTPSTRRYRDGSASPEPERRNHYRRVYMTYPINKCAQNLQNIGLGLLVNPAWRWVNFILFRQQLRKRKEERKAFLK